MRRSLLIIFFIWTSSSSAQDTIVSQKPFSSNILSIKNPSSSISFSGYYRFLGFVRNQQETFPNNSGKTVVISSGDAYREPMFLLKLNGKTRDNITFGADLMLNSLYKGPSAELKQNLTLVYLSCFLQEQLFLLVHLGEYHRMNQPYKNNLKCHFTKALV